MILNPNLYEYNHNFTFKLSMKVHAFMGEKMVQALTQLTSHSCIDDIVVMLSWYNKKKLLLTTTIMYMYTCIWFHHVMYLIWLMMTQCKPPKRAKQASLTPRRAVRTGPAAFTQRQSTRTVQVQQFYSLICKAQEQTRAHARRSYTPTPAAFVPRRCTVPTMHYKCTPSWFFGVLMDD